MGCGTFRYRNVKRDSYVASIVDISNYYSVLTVSLVNADEKLHFTQSKCKITSVFVHQYLLCGEVDIDTDIPTTCWLSTWWHCSNIYKAVTCRYCIPDIKVIWYSIESQSGKTSVIVTVVVQCDGSQVDSCWEYEQQLVTT